MSSYGSAESVAARVSRIRQFARHRGSRNGEDLFVGNEHTLVGPPHGGFVTAVTVAGALAGGRPNGLVAGVVRGALSTEPDNSPGSARDQHLESRVRVVLRRWVR